MATGPTTGLPTTGLPTTGFPTTGFPTTGFPTTGFPTTGTPTGVATGPTTGLPTTGLPTTGAPTGLATGPTTGFPTGPTGVTVGGPTGTTLVSAPTGGATSFGQSTGVPELAGRVQAGPENFAGFLPTTGAKLVSLMVISGLAIVFGSLFMVVGRRKSQGKRV
ncbi:LPXTG cell wall anchor domain-containing protein [Antrihabitans spumae]|uniref:LPXTG cell wall anchor domain-containing protein n=1 Tax=Antrihabitans spumae TaxID=3373370 RepID=A0ABW7K5D2_9NOCA